MKQIAQSDLIIWQSLRKFKNKKIIFIIKFNQLIYILNLTNPNLSGNGAFTMLSQNVVTSLDTFSSGEIIIKLSNEFMTISKSVSNTMFSQKLEKSWRFKNGI